MYTVNKPLFSLFRLKYGQAISQGRRYFQRNRSLTVTKTKFECPAIEEDEEKLELAALPFHSIPGPTNVENLVSVWRQGVHKFHHIIADHFEKYGPIFKFPIPGNSAWVCVSDPQDFERVFRADKYPPIRPDTLSSLTYFVEKGLTEGIIGNDEHWHRHRLAMAKNLLRPAEIEHLPSTFCAICDDYINILKEGRNVDLLGHFHNWSTEMIAFATFGVRIDISAGQSNDKVISFMDASCEYMEAESKLLLSIPFHKLFKTPTLKRLYRSLDAMWDITSGYIKESKKQEKSFVQKVSQDNRYQLSDDEIIQCALTMFNGGIDTTSMTTVNALYHLSNVPKVQDKLLNEIQEVLPNNEKPTAKHLAKMPYLRAVIKESLRVSPTVLGTTRHLRDPIVLNGYEVPAKTTILLSTTVSKAMQEKVFGDFENFRPERWVRELATIHPFASFPFGFGLRMCVGRRIAEMETSLFLVRFLRQFEIEQSDFEEDKLDWKFNMALEPDRAINFNLRKRT